MTTIGPHRPNDRRGLLVFEYLPDDLQDAEDSTQDADHRKLCESEVVSPVTFSRPATDAERTLLGHLGYTVPAGLATRVTWMTNGLRSRAWPQLENGS